MVLLFYTTYIIVDLAHHRLFHAKVGKGGISKVFEHKIVIIIIGEGSKLML